MSAGNSRGFTLAEALVSLVILMIAMGGVGSLLIQNTRVDKQQRMKANTQASARNSLEILVARLRSAGWDPSEIGIDPVAFDTDPYDGTEHIEIFADLDDSGVIDVDGEQVLIRHVGDRIEYRPNADPNEPFQILAKGITNDADGDGTIEPMFVPDSVSSPTRITVTVTARSTAPDPLGGDYIRYTVSSDVVIRKRLDP